MPIPRSSTIALKSPGFLAICQSRVTPTHPQRSILTVMVNVLDLAAVFFTP